MALVAAVLLGPGVAAQVAPREYVDLGRVAGVVTRPDSGPPPQVAVVYENGSNGASHRMCGELARRGFLTWCAIPRLNFELNDDWTDTALDIKAAIQYLTRQRGIRSVVLYGHSGGGAIAGFYQAVAENGVAYCQAPRKLAPCRGALADLPRADAVVFPDAHPGMDVMSLRGLNPSISVAGGELRVDPQLDPFSVANGFDPNGHSHFSAAFQRRYFRAQADQMRRLVDRALAMRAAARANPRLDPAAQLISIAGFGIATHLDELDPGIAVTMSTRRPERLLRNDGTITVTPIRSVWTGHSPMVHFSQDLISTADAFLALRAVRATDSMSAVDWCSANSDTVCNTAHIRAPVLFIAAGASDFIADEERMYDGSPAADKEFLVVQGALHGGAPCTECENTPGQYSNSETNQYDYIANWIRKRLTDQSPRR